MSQIRSTEPQTLSPSPFVSLVSFVIHGDRSASMLAYAGMVFNDVRSIPNHLYSEDILSFLISEAYRPSCASEVVSASDLGSLLRILAIISTPQTMSLYHQLSSDHPSTRHEGHGADEACHDIIALIPGVFLCIHSWGKKHTVEVDIEFFDAADEEVGYSAWVPIWSSVLQNMRSDAYLSERQNDAISPRSIGLTVSVIATGRRARAVYAVHWDLSRRAESYRCCQELGIFFASDRLELR